MNRKLHIVGELMNNSYARARKAFTERDPAGYGQLAKLQADLGAPAERGAAEARGAGKDDRAAFVCGVAVEDVCVDVDARAAVHAQQAATQPPRRLRA